MFTVLKESILANSIDKITEEQLKYVTRDSDRNIKYIVELGLRSNVKPSILCVLIKSFHWSKILVILELANLYNVKHYITKEEYSNYLDDLFCTNNVTHVMVRLLKDKGIEFTDNIYSKNLSRTVMQSIKNKDFLPVLNSVHMWSINFWDKDKLNSIVKKY